MHDTTGSPLAAWGNFYVIVGSAAAALTGLQFVVMVLVAQVRRRSSGKEIDAFGTPTIVHFSAVLLISAISCAPWPSIGMTAAVFGICGAAGVVYVVMVMMRARGQSGYQLVLEDWVWHTALPFVAYAALLAGSIWVARRSAVSLFAVAATALLLLFIGIHNAWDTVTYITLDHIQSRDN